MQTQVCDWVRPPCWGQVGVGGGAACLVLTNIACHVSQHQMTNRDDTKVFRELISEPLESVMRLQS